jgi:RNA polymerase sigma-70 factor (ECF subfamily)
MQNVVAISAQARSAIAGQQGPGDVMLLAGIAAGSRSAMHALYSRHSVRVYRFVLRMVRDVATAEDIVSQVFLDVWKSAGRFEGRSQVSTWLLSIARFKVLTALRQRCHLEIDREDVRALADGAESAESLIDRASTGAILRGCIARLSPAHREIVNLVYFHETTVEEASRILGIPPATVKTRMFYARKALGELLRGAGVDSLAA